MPNAHSERLGINEELSLGFGSDVGHERVKGHFRRDVPRQLDRQILQLHVRRHLARMKSQLDFYLLLLLLLS